MGKLLYKLGKDSAVFFVRRVLVVQYQVFDIRIPGVGLLIDRNRSPGVTVYPVFIGINKDVKASYLVCSGTCLEDRNSVYHSRLLKECMRMTSYDNIHSPGGIQQLCQLLVLLKAYMCEQHCKVNVYGIVGITDFSDFLRRIFKGDECTDELIRLALHQGNLCKYSDEQDLHSTNFQYLARLKESGVIGLDMKVCINYRKLSTLSRKRRCETR